MLVVPGAASRDTCDGLTRRNLLQVGGSAVLGLSLPGLFAHAAENGSNNAPGAACFCLLPEGGKRHGYTTGAARRNAIASCTT